LALNDDTDQLLAVRIIENVGVVCFRGREIFPTRIKVKGKVIPGLFLTEHHAMKAYWGSGGIAPLIL
jgi:hypothetical protein